MIKKGDILIAINPCIMEGSGEQTLTVGNKYTIVKAEHEDYDEEEFMIQDDYKQEHWFTNDGEYFKPLIKENLVGGELL